MPTFIVLLHGVNVGKAKRVPMADFKTVLLGLGCTSATTLLNGGNAVVSAARQAPATLGRRIAGALEARFGFAVPVVAKTADEFERVIAGADLVQCSTLCGTYGPADLPSWQGANRSDASWHREDLQRRHGGKGAAP